MTADEFYAWLAMVQGLHELVDGEPLMMAGATNRHDRIARDALRHPGNHLKGHCCQPFTADITMPIPASNRRQGDVGVDRGTPDDLLMETEAPMLVLELPLFALRLPLGALYAGLAFKPRPMLGCAAASR